MISGYPKGERDAEALKPLEQSDVGPDGAVATREEVPFDCVNTSVFVELHGEVPLRR